MTNEKIDIDLNTLFNLSYTFEPLKLMIKKMLTKQNKTEERLKAIEDELQKTKNERNELQKAVTQNIATNEKLKSIENSIYNSKKKKGQHGKKGESGHLDDSEEEYYNGNSSFLDNLELEQLKKRISEIEKTLKNMKIMQSGGNRGSSDDLDMHKAGLKSINELVEDLKLKSDTMSKDLEDIKVKVTEFNFYDVLKDCQTEGGNIEASKLLVMNLESKVFKKFEIMDEKLKKSEEDLYKTKTNVINVKNQHEANQRALGNLKDDLKNLLEVIHTSNDQTSNQINDIDNKVNDNYKKTIKQLEDLDKKYNKEINAIQKRLKAIEDHAINNVNDNLGQGNAGISERDLKILKDLNRRVLEQDRSIKQLVSTINLNDIYEKINQLKHEIEQKGSQQDIYDLNEKINKNAMDISQLKDSCTQLIEDRIKAFQEINLTIKRIETLNSMVIDLKESVERSSAYNKNNSIDLNKYLDVAVFNDFVKSNTKEQDMYRRELEQLRLFIKDHEEILKKKASDEDLKNLEGVLLAKIEELKLHISKRFADKNDTSKSIRYLDTQLKHIIEVYIKKMDKGDNWLLAKKPIGGYSCASCEAYIGELQDKTDYIPWNKYPIRDQNDKAYRIGNGFSRMLNMLNLDTKSTYESTEGNEKKNFNTSLPTIRLKKNDDRLNTSGDNATLNVQSEEYKTEQNINPDDPKVVKIYRKNKVPQSIETKNSGNQ